ncbi:MAG TPA: CmcI family methyltransferase, partial [Isosphaeraceae bacterium]|nr:CmcI family methyltransferase [Isosphaeraceae bacterium]
DLPNGPWGGGYAEEDIPRLITMTQHQQKMQLFRGDSHKPEMLKATERVLTGRKLDMLFIDGDHSYEGVKQDWEMYSPLVKSGGIVVFHDIVPHDFEGCDVDLFWNELKHDYEYEEFITPVEIPYLMKPKSEGGAGKDWGGIGVIHIP